MIYPSFLPDKGTIGIVAPSFGATTEPYATALASAEDAWGKLGYTVVEMPAVHAADGVGIATTPARSAHELEQAWQDEALDVLVSAGGGELMCETMGNLDLDVLAQARPKWFMGMSDNSNLSFVLTCSSDVASIYGPNAPAFGMVPWHLSLHDAMGVITGKAQQANKSYPCFRLSSYPAWQLESLRDADHPLEPYNTTQASSLRAFDATGQLSPRVSCQGRLLGGCLDVLQILCGTRLDAVASFNERYQGDGVVWFLEACELDPVGTRRAIWQLAQAGWFACATGFVIGRPQRYDDCSFGLDQEQAIRSALEQAGLAVPVILDADFGHLPPMMPLVLGSYCKVELDQAHLDLHMSFV